MIYGATPLVKFEDAEGFTGVAVKPESGLVLIARSRNGECWQLETALNLADAVEMAKGLIEFVVNVAPEQASAEEKAVVARWQREQMAIDLPEPVEDVDLWIDAQAEIWADGMDEMRDALALHAA